MTGWSEFSSRTSFARVTPSPPGMQISVTTASMRLDLTISRASLPFLASTTMRSFELKSRPLKFHANQVHHQQPGLLGLWTSVSSDTCQVWQRTKSLGDFFDYFLGPDVSSLDLFRSLWQLHLHESPLISKDWVKMRILIVEDQKKLPLIFKVV